MIRPRLRACNDCSRCASLHVALHIIPWFKFSRRRRRRRRILCARTCAAAVLHRQSLFAAYRASHFPSGIRLSENYFSRHFTPTSSPSYLNRRFARDETARCVNYRSMKPLNVRHSAAAFYNSAAVKISHDSSRYFSRGDSHYFSAHSQTPETSALRAGFHTRLPRDPAV